MSPPTDEELLRRFGRGDDRAFELLVERYGGPLKGYATRMLKNAEQGEEIYVETFLRVARERGKWEARGTVRGYLFTIAHRICLDRLRRRKVELAGLDNAVTFLVEPAVRPNPEAQALLGERAAQLEVALARLPQEHREVLLMRTIHGLSAAETAAATGLTEDQVNSQLSYARKKLREELDVAPQASRRVR